jgi:cytochrome bd-type quinol oxidase subunit 2
MSVLRTATGPSRAIESSPRVPMVGLLRALLLGEAVAGLALAIFLSLLAAGERTVLGGDAGRAAEESIRFAAAGAFLFAIFAAVASRGARRRRSWSWTLAAILQVLVAVGTGLAVLVAEWQPIFIVGFVAAALVMLVLSTSPVRRALGQE